MKKTTKNTNKKKSIVHFTYNHISDSASRITLTYEHSVTLLTSKQQCQNFAYPFNLLSDWLLGRSSDADLIDYKMIRILNLRVIF